MKTAKIIAIAAGILLLAFAALMAQQPGILGGIDIQPNPMDKDTVITVYVNQNASFNVTIETHDGRVVKSLYWGTTNKDITIPWDRLSDDGTYVPKGTYFVVVNYSGRYTSTKKTLILK